MKELNFGKNINTSCLKLHAVLFQRRHKKIKTNYAKYTDFLIFLKIKNFEK